MKHRNVETSTRSTAIRAIRQLAAAWRSGWHSGDAGALVALYTDEPVLMPQGHAAISSKKAILALYRAVLGEVTIRSSGKLMEVEACGDLGYFWSTYTLTATPKRGGRAIRSKGKSIFIVKRQHDGAWKIARLIDNSDPARGAKAGGGNAS